jgi:WD40 repeat protein
MTKPVFTQNTEFKLPMGVLDGSLAAAETQIVAACLDGVYRAELVTGEFEKLYSHDSYVSSVHWLRDETVLSAGYDGSVRWFNPALGQVTRLVQLHQFWSWDLAVSPDQKLFASVTGQYLAGGYQYEPLAEREPSLKIGSIETGETLYSLPHIPPVQAVAFSPDGAFVAAGNLMGEVRVYDVRTGDLVANFTTDAFTSWGIIKSHSYIGGIFAIEFTPSGDQLLLAGMGHMKDPMAGNGRQLWQNWSWRDETPKLIAETNADQAGEGLMEALAIDPAGQHFLMGGRLRGGNWNVAVFDLATGNLVAELKTGYRVTAAKYTAAGNQLLLFGAQGQPERRNEAGQFPHFGRVQIFDVTWE